MLKFFIEGFKPKTKNKMIKTAWLSLAQAFDRVKESDKHAKQKALAAN
jgi:hypothetical protein